ncbi:hypothetical protein Pmani_028500 [Petrolisthes manimaculis]|uniref:N-acetyltransferase ESCO2 n=1 Tax=Petrolisthes manimaculis TaxID=1843537 RepID=A0AAE1TUU2_9EUCA|nr:hypothetical protein Pmani_028500 [Petrolisthes manimaculis]
MAPVVPDCGIFATPRREPSLKMLQCSIVDLSTTTTTTNTTKSIPPPSPLAASPSLAPRLLSSSEISDINLDSGFSLGFYKSPKNLFSSVTKVEIQPRSVKSIRRPREGLNKGVGHGIKKPKLKAKDKLKKEQHAKAVAKRLKKSIYIPYLPSTRSPVKKTGSKLEEISDFIPKANNGKFFTSKSRAAATVHIGKNIRLSAKYGDVTLKQVKQRERGFTKKNIGRRVENELQQYLEQPSVDVIHAASLPSMLVNPRPVPTRVPGTPSPKKKPLVKSRPCTTSPRRVVKTDSAAKTKTTIVSGNNNEEGELLDLEKILNDWDNGSETDCGSPDKSKTKMTSKDNDNPSTPTRRSPRKVGLSTPTRRSPRKTGDVETPRRQSPRKLIVNSTNSPTRSPRISKTFATPTRGTPRTARNCTESPAKSPRIFKDCVTPSRRTPRRLDNGGTESPARSPTRKLKECNTPTRISPRKALGVSSTKKQSAPEKNTEKLEISEAQPKTKSSPKDTSGNIKMFPIFDPKQRRSDQVVLGSTQKNYARTNTRIVVAENDTQMTLDAGQKRFGIEQCTVCGVVYEIANPSDEANHKYHHDRHVNTLKFMGWKKERRVRDLDYQGARVVMVSGEDPETWWRKVEELREMIDTDLGFVQENQILVKENTKVFLRILNQKIVGCLIAENISKANRIIPRKKKDSGGLVCCSEEPTTVWAGVGRIWVLESERGKGHASTLVDCMRENMVPNFILTLDQIAFSDPTENGMIFAEKYTKRPDFLVYRRVV